MHRIETVIAIRTATATATAIKTIKTMMLIIMVINAR